MQDRWKKEAPTVFIYKLIAGYLLSHIWTDRTAAVEHIPIGRY